MGSNLSVGTCRWKKNIVLIATMLEPGSILKRNQVNHYSLRLVSLDQWFSTFLSSRHTNLEKSLEAHIDVEKYQKSPILR